MECSPLPLMSGEVTAIWEWDCQLSCPFWLDYIHNNFSLSHIYTPCIHAGPMECCYGKLWHMDRCHWKTWMSKTLLTGLRMDLCSTRGNMVAIPLVTSLYDCACCQFLSFMHTAHSLGMRLRKCPAKFRVSTSYSLACLHIQFNPMYHQIQWYYKSQTLYSHIPLWVSLIACSYFLSSPSIFAADFTF